MNHDRRDEELDAAYRRASAAAAAQPGAKTRAAILAEAAAAARRRTPAANAPRYWMRAVAGVAVVGVALLVWRQVDYRLPGEDAAVVTVQGMREESAGAPSSAPAAAIELQADLAASDTERVEADAPRSDVDSTRTAQAPAPVQPFVAPQPLPDLQQSPPRQASAVEPEQIKAQQQPGEAADRQPAVEALVSQGELEEVQVTGARVAPPPPAPPPPTATRSPVLPAFDPAELLRRHFPAQYASDRPHRLWLVLDAAGDVVQQGELAPGETLEDLAPRVASALGDRVPGAWQQHQLQNAAGQSVDLAIARVR